MHTAIHGSQVELVIVFVHARGGDEVVFAQGFGDLGKIEIGREELRWVNNDLVLRRASADEIHARYAGDAQETGLKSIASSFPESGNVASGTRQANADDWKRGEGKPPSRGGGAGRKL